MVDAEVFDKAQAKLAATEDPRLQGPQDRLPLARGLRGLCHSAASRCGGCPAIAGNGLEPGYICAEYGRWGNRAPSGCGHFRVEHDLLESLVLDYLTQTAPQIKALLDATTATDVEAARPSWRPSTMRKINWHSDVAWTCCDSSKSTCQTNRPAAGTTGCPSKELYGCLFRAAKPKIEKQVADKEAELESLLDGFAGLTPKTEGTGQQAGGSPPRGDRRPPALTWQPRVPVGVVLQRSLAARQEALERATATLNQEGHFRQKAEVLKTVVDKIVCHFRRVGKRATLESIDVIPAEDAAVRPLTFPGLS